MLRVVSLTKSPRVLTASNFFPGYLKCVKLFFQTKFTDKLTALWLENHREDVLGTKFLHVLAERRTQLGGRPRCSLFWSHIFACDLSGPQHQLPRAPSILVHLASVFYAQEYSTRGKFDLGIF